MIHVLIVDDERNIHKAYSADIQSRADRYRLVDAIVNAKDALMICSTRQVDMILMDINTAHNESGIEETKLIKQKYPKTKIIITTSYMDPDAMRRAKEAGADSFWFKDISPDPLIEVMDRTADGEHYWPEKNPDVRLGAVLFSDLTAAEQEVLLQLTKSISIRKMAEELSVEETTIKYHLKNICGKVQCKNKTELLVLAIQSRMVLPQKMGNEQD